MNKFEKLQAALNARRCKKCDGLGIIYLSDFEITSAKCPSCRGWHKRQA